jgi:hypothetical protein
MLLLNVISYFVKRCVFERHMCIPTNFHDHLLGWQHFDHTSNKLSNEFYTELALG